MTNTDRLAQALRELHEFSAAKFTVDEQCDVEEILCRDCESHGCIRMKLSDAEKALAEHDALASLAPAALSPALTEMSSEGDFVVHDCPHCHRCVTYSRKSADSWVAYRDLTSQVAALTAQCEGLGKIVRKVGFGDYEDIAQLEIEARSAIAAGNGEGV